MHTIKYKNKKHTIVSWEHVSLCLCPSHPVLASISISLVYPLAAHTSDFAKSHAHHHTKQINICNGQYNNESRLILPRYTSEVTTYFSCSVLLSMKGWSAGWERKGGVHQPVTQATRVWKATNGCSRKTFAYVST
ncbi:hypothetical protein E2C01_082762 [Portunus trituberculatus]|uniref:Uncharacterized protein n=1 Tax=Portunus trituberculatus TaxID=210409 RepID=A0A5B7IVE9_PORTR|nr:hypothetical protein [Portunus trituberculatus]